MKEKISILSILANIFLAGGKIIVGIISKSAAILSSGIDSSIDIFSSIIGYVGIKISNKPADKEHPYGHYKFEVLSSIVIAIIILITGLAIIYNAYQSFFKPEEVKIGYLGFGIMVFSVLLNEIMARLKIYYGKKENSIALLSDGIHSRVDVYTSLVIFVGLFLTPYWIYIDVLLAFLMGVYIIKQAISIGKEGIESLLDVSASDEIEEKIKLIAKNQNIVIDALKTQKKGSIASANLEIKLPNDLNVEKATQLSNQLRDELIKKIEKLQYVVIQIKSYDMENSFYKTSFGRGFGWQKQGKFKGEVEKAAGQGPGGYCVCLKCGYKIKHQKGTPCSTLRCPNCNLNLERH